MASDEWQNSAPAAFLLLQQRGDWTRRPKLS
jgi:hypothetical protein